MKIREALRWGEEQLADSPTPGGDTRLLLQYALHVNRSHLVAQPEQALTQAQAEAFRSHVARARHGEPVPYIVGEAPFYGLDFIVTPAVLIPRPETELLVEAAIEWAQTKTVHHVVDTGTGSGCIAVILARYLPAVRVEATDISEAALTVAQENAARHGVAHRICFHHSSLLAQVAAKPDLIVANLPYVSDVEWTTLADGVKWYEPAGALRGGPEGLTVIRQLLLQARTRLQQGGAIFLEIGWRQGAAVAQLGRSVFPTASVAVRPDYAGHDRIVVIETA